MEIYLPIADIPVNIIALLLLGLMAGILSGLFGIGGGFLITPILIFMGITAPVAVASSANQILASSFSGCITHWRRNNIDIKMGVIMIIGGFIGSSYGIYLFSMFKNSGQIDLVISLCYILILSLIGGLMGIESFRNLIKKKTPLDNDTCPAISRKEKLFSRLPLKLYFPHSDLNISLIIPIIVSMASGMLVSFMGIGGGFIMIPAMIYLIGMPTSVVIGTSLFQIIFVTANVTFLHAINNQAVDIMLVMILILTSVVGVQYGTKLSIKIPAIKLRLLLSIIILIMAIKLGSNLFLTPSSPYSIIPTIE